MMSLHQSRELVGLCECIRSFACSETTPFYPQRGIPFLCTFSYSHSEEKIRKAGQFAFEIIQTNLSKEQEDKLRADFGE